MLTKFSFRDPFVAEFVVAAADLEQAGYAELKLSQPKVAGDVTGLANDATRAEVAGSANLSTGFDWGTTNQDFDITVTNNGVAAAVATVALAVLTANRDAALAAVNAALITAGVTTVQAIANGANSISLRHTGYGTGNSFVLAAGSPDALATIGLAVGAAAGTNGTEYSMEIERDGVAQVITVPGFQAQTVTALLAAILADLTNVTVALNTTTTIRFTHNVTGAGTIEITDLGTLGAALFGGSVVTIGDKVDGSNDAAVRIVVKQGATANKPAPNLMWIAQVRDSAGQEKTGCKSSYDRNTGILSVVDGSGTELAADDVVTVLGTFYT